MKNLLILIMLISLASCSGGESNHKAQEETRQESELPDNSMSNIDDGRDNNQNEDVADNGDDNNNDDSNDDVADDGEDNNNDDSNDDVADNGDDNNNDDSNDDVADNGDDNNNDDSNDDVADNDEDNNNDDSNDDVADNGDDDNVETFDSSSFMNVMKRNEKIVFTPFKYKEFFEKDAGRSIASVNKNTALSLTRDDINVFALVEEGDLDRVKDREIKPGSKYYAELTVDSDMNEDDVSLCVTYQPDNKETITQSGRNKINLKKKDIVTILDEDIECEDAKVNGDSVQEGIVEYYLNAEENSEIEARVYGQMELKKAKNKNKEEDVVGTQVEFDVNYTR